MKLKRIILVILAAVMLFSAASCGTDLSSSAAEKRTVMTVYGFDVPYEMYRYAALMHLRDQMEIISANAENGGAVTTADGENLPVSDVAASLTDEERKAVAEKVEKDSVSTVVGIYSLFYAAKTEGIDPFGDMINSLTDMKMEEIRATYENDKAYKETLELYHMNNSVYSILTRYEIVFEQLYELYVKNGDIDITDEAAIEYMNGDNAARAKQILISFERHSEDEALSLANDVYGKVISGCVGEDGSVDESEFDTLTSEYGEDLFMFKNTDGYYICRGYTDKAFEEAVFDLEIGEVCAPVRISAGYSIILRAEKDPAFIESNIDTLSEACVTGIYRTILDGYSANAEVEYSDEFQELDIYSMK